MFGREKPSLVKGTTMTVEEILAEMDRRPDPQMLIEWLEGRNDLPVYVRFVINRYFEAVEAE